MRGLPALLLVGCTWLTEAGDEDRLDRDGDGVPVLFDCDDDDPGLWNLETVGVTIGCDEVVPPYSADESRFEIATCLDPGESEALLELPGDQHVYAVVVNEPTRVDVTVTLLPLESSEVSFDMVVVGNEGSTCSRDACVAGLPVVARATDESTEQVVGGLASPGDPFYVLLSHQWNRERQPYSLSVSCFP